MKNFRYYRCSGTDAYRFGGERICSNSQIQGNKLEAAIWSYVSKMIKDPACLEETLSAEEGSQRAPLHEDLNALKVQRQKLQHGIDRLIDTLADGVIDKDQFTVRMNRAKARLADLDAKLALQAANQDHRAQVRSALTRLAELSDHLASHLIKANWATKREIIRAVVQRIEIGPTSIAIVLRLPDQTSVRGAAPILVTLSRA